MSARSRGGRNRAAAAGWIALAATLATGCFEVHDGSDGSVDGSVPGDGGERDGSGDRGIGEDGSCYVGTTRLCGAWCEERCTPTASCTPGLGGVCVNGQFSSRGSEDCRIDMDLSIRQYCYSGGLCLTESFDDGHGFGGTCVDAAFCRWMEDERTRQIGTCRYSDGTSWVNGPPDEACGTGAHPDNPFCGGRCGDTCPPNSRSASSHDPPGCYGISETRAFGVCVPVAFEWCAEGYTEYPLGICSGETVDAGGDPGAEPPPCACMRIAQEDGGPFPRFGGAVTAQSCLAYRTLYPAQVSCRDVNWLEL